MQLIKVTKGAYFITTDSTKMDVTAIHKFLSEESHWAKNVPFTIVQKSVEHSLCFGIFYRNLQVGFARVISDYATIAYLGDVYIIPQHRKKGLSKWLMEVVLAHPDLQRLRRWILLTADAHDLYKQFGWQPVAKPERYMEIYNDSVYKP